MPTKATTTKPAAKPDWPESTEKRPLFVVLNPKEMETISRKLAQTVPDIAALQRDAKSSATQWKARVEAKETEQAQLSSIVSEGREERLVPCSWAFECSGVDAETNNRIYHPEKKALFRDDTGELLEVRDISSAERQMALPMEETEAAA